MKKLTFVAVLSGGHPLPDFIVLAEDEKEGRNIVWNERMDDAQRDNCESIELVEQQDISEGDLVNLVSPDRFATVNAPKPRKAAAMYSSLEDTPSFGLDRERAAQLRKDSE